jgi:primosomal protein N'
MSGRIGDGPFPFLNRPESAHIRAMPRRVVDVLVPVALDQAYSYRVPAELELAPGDVVCVPLGAREVVAVVWADNPKARSAADNRLKDVEQKLELPPLRPELRSLVDWVANYTRPLARHGAAHVPAHGRASRPERSASACGSRARRRRA